MKMVILLLILAIFYIARLLSLHHENSLFKAHIKLKHKWSGYLLTGTHPTLKPKPKRDKLLIQGILLYALCIFTLFFCIYQLYYCPVIEEDIVILEGGTHGARGAHPPFVVHTVNDAASFLMCAATLMLELSVLFAEGMKACFNSTEESAGNLIFSMLINLFFTVAFLCISYLSFLRISTFFT